jgi:polysaccharide biosynthesis transport protein
MSEELDEPVFLSWEEYWAIVVRRRWLILLSVFTGWFLIWGASWIVPATYQSESLIVVDQQKVPDQYVVPNISSNLQDRLQSLTEQILSRTNLEETIERLHLYPHHRSLFGFGDPVEQMRRNIKIDLVSAPDRPGEYTAFRMSYAASTPELAQTVNRELTSLFIADNLNVQRQLSENTTAFLESQLADSRARMEEQEAKVASFKATHMGDLPSQLESNVQILAGLQSQLQNSQQALDAARRQKLYLESLLQQFMSAQASLDSGDINGAGAAQSLDKQLLDMRLALQELQARYTPEHPDIIALKDKIAKAERLKKQSEAEAIASQKEHKDSGTTDSAVPTGAQSSSPNIMQLQSQLKANQLEIVNIQQHEKDLESQISGYQSRLNLTPETEQELTAISRGYEESKSNYNSLLQKKMQSQLATSLEHRQQGEQFRIVDPPSLPTKPSAPNHLLFSMAGLLVGAFLGLSLTALLEMMNVRIRKEQDLAGIVPVSVLVGIPHLATPHEARNRERIWWTELGAATGLVVLIVLGNLYALLKA